MRSILVCGRIKRKIALGMWLNSNQVHLKLRSRERTHHDGRRKKYYKNKQIYYGSLGKNKYEVNFEKNKLEKRGQEESECIKICKSIWITKWEGKIFIELIE